MTEMTKVAPGNDAARLLQAATEALSDGMVERLSVTAANALEVVDKLNDEDVRNGLLAMLDAVGKLHRSGALDTLVEVLFLIHAARAAATDSMVDRFFGFIEHMINNLGTEELATLAHETRGALEDALDECVQDNSTGLIGTLKMLNRPETQQALRFMLAFSCKLRGRAAVLQKTPPV